MGAYTGMKALLGDLIPIAANLQYPDSSICILEGDIDSLQRNFPQTYSNLLSCRHNRDNRSPIKYGQDLVASWIYEDYLIGELSKCGLSIERAGTDWKREVLANRNVSSASDCLVKLGNRTRKLEIMNDYKGYWHRYGRIDLRDDKYEKLVRENAIFIGVSLPESEFIILDFSKKTNAIYIASHISYGGKPAYQIKIDENRLKKASLQDMAETIKGILQHQ